MFVCAYTMVKCTRLTVTIFHSKLQGLWHSKQAFQQADPQLLEPVNHVEVLCPDELTGAVMGDLQSRRAIVEGIDTQGHFQKVIAKSTAG